MKNTLDQGPFFHGTIVDLQPGDLLKPGHKSNYRREITMNHIYFTALVNGAGLAAEIAAELDAGLVEDTSITRKPPRVYEVEPLGDFDNDPNVTDKKFPGNPTRSYRSDQPLKIIREITDWTRLTPEALAMWRENLRKITSDDAGEIIN
ncbi:NAD(+)--rifampin ADP-ribosyltransferase [Corynebacterium crudilactis]|uniref:Rifampin ADP-ribosyl transferase n=1 Tax=Corynebacterium crudilactis TaxID=1652495 RepID=A0A172QWC2_9CORY|nr:NAD(+)--rifampin ADP-ribosyltransferase [Corynebacterium crudilactis]ANE04946.1 rifampin ADP-ribosyl transferase [Corynebacterium crudilactis]